MKRVILSLVTIAFALSLRAQTDTLSSESRPNFKIDLGLSVGATLYNNGNDHSPYYSHHGFTVQLPVMAHWQFAPKWQLSSGLRYDFTWSPLYYLVEPSGSWDDYPHQGLQFIQKPTTATQKAHSYINHLGIPIELKWNPISRNRNALGLAVDLFAGYAVAHYFVINNLHAPGTVEQGASNTVLQSTAIQPWKVEVGFSLTTSFIGLTHGIRFSANLLPTYQDPATGEKIYTSGITLFL